MERISRRQVLAGVGTATASLAGCVGPFTSSSGDEGLAVSTLAVRDSPGGEMPVAASDTASLIDFFATWCQPCKPQMAELRAVHEQFPELHMISISWEQNAEAIKQFWREYEGTWPVAQDTDLRAPEAYEIDGRLPTKIVVDADGKEVWRSVGLSSAETIAGHVEDALA